MKTKTSPYSKFLTITVLFVAASLLISACSPAKAQGAGTAPTDISKDPIIETPEMNPKSLVLSISDLAKLDPNEILLELTYEPTFSRIEDSYIYGRSPAFTLFADGRVVYSEESEPNGEVRILTAALTPKEVVALLQQGYDLGFEKLESFTDFCKTGANGEQQCAADAAYTIIRMRIASGELKEVKTYADFSNEPQAFASIRDLLSTYTRQNAELYIPSKAALFISPTPEDVTVDIKEWPLDPALLQLSKSDLQLGAIVLEGKALTQYLDTAGRNVGDTFFKANDVLYRTYLVPWLPGVDYSAELQADFPTR